MLGNLVRQQVGAAAPAGDRGGPLGIRVNAVAPGIVPTALFAAAPAGARGGDDMVRRASTTPLRRAGTPEEVAAVDGGSAIVNGVRPSGGAGAWDHAGYDRELYSQEPGGA